MRYFGYIRVSSRDQDPERQREALQEYAQKQGIEYEAVFEDRTSGKDFAREQYQLLKQTAAPGDKIIIKELDRLGRSYKEMKQEMSHFKNRKITVVVLDLPVFSDTVQDESLAELLNSIMLELLGYISEKELEHIKRRQKEGIEKAKKQGKKFGRPKRQLPGGFEKYYEMWQKGEITAVEFARLIGVSRRTVYRYIEKYEAEIKADAVQQHNSQLDESEEKSAGKDVQEDVSPGANQPGGFYCRALKINNKKAPTRNFEEG